MSLSPTALAPFAAALYAARPAVLRGAAAAWSGAWAALQPSALAARFGQRRVPVAQLREGALKGKDSGITCGLDWT